MENRIVEKYVRDLEGMLQEIKHWEEEAPLWETTAEEYMYESAVVFAFGGLYRFFNFEGIHFGTSRGLDCGVIWKGDGKGVEFEIRSQGFKEHIKKEHVIPADYKDTIIVCWKHDWDACPEDIDVIELRYFWELANKQKSN